MATITLEYDARNASLRKALDLVVSLGAKVKTPEKKLSSAEISLKQANEGRLMKAKSVDDLFKQCGVNV